MISWELTLAFLLSNVSYFFIRLKAIKTKEKNIGTKMLESNKSRYLKYFVVHQNVTHKEKLILT
jgi:hypothetical protein